MKFERWNKQKGEFLKNEKIDRFIEEINNVCVKHNLSISHEDNHGVFIIEEYSDHNITWLKAAVDGTTQTAK